MLIWLIVVLLFGHLALWVALFNRLHGFPVPRWAIRPSELLTILAAAGGSAWVIRRLWFEPQWLERVLAGWRHQPWWAAYALVCGAMAAWVVSRWLWQRGWRIQTDCLLSNHTEQVDVAGLLEENPMRGWSTRLFACLPGNQMFDLCLHEKAVELPQLPRTLDGISILHLSDIHFTGKITRPFFDYVVERSNELNADMVAITGDILEHEGCYPWLAETLGRLTHRHGAYFVLGNHDRRVRDVRQLRQALVNLGFHDLGTTVHVERVRGERLLLAGNELPWFGPPPALPGADGGGKMLRILLSHSPDQITWATRRGFDLLLAGHTHGGHIRIPHVGPLVCPSRFGVKYACGLFYEAPTLMHVSRGISGLDPLRFYCPPEVTKLVLRSPGQSFGKA